MSFGLDAAWLLISASVVFLMLCAFVHLLLVRRFRNPYRYLPDSVVWFLAVILLAVLVLLFWPSRAFPQERIELPITFDKVEGTILVSAQVNGFDAVLLLDTGSQVGAISERFIQHLPMIGKASVAGIGGQEKADAVMAEVSAGSLKTRMMFLAIRGDAFVRKRRIRVDGLLGMNFFAGWKRACLDLDGGKLILEK